MDIYGLVLLKVRFGASVLWVLLTSRADLQKDSGILFVIAELPLANSV